MIKKAPHEFFYSEFTSFVRRFNQEAMLVAVTQRALSLPRNFGIDNRGDSALRATPPWALAAVAKAAIVHGNAHRRAVPRERDLVTARHMHNTLVAPELDVPALNSAFAILARLAFEQFPYYERGLPELARPVAFFDDHSGRKSLEVISKESMRELVGADMVTAAGIVLMLATGAEINDGYFNPGWLDQINFAELLAELPREEILAVVNSLFAWDMDQFRREDAEASVRTPLPHLDRYAFNPLTSRPFVRLSDGRLIAPIPQLIPRRLTPLELYYAGIKRWGTAFTRDLGELLEDYVGRQFQTLPDATVHSEVVYMQKRQELKSIDWFVVFDDLVVLIEAKATRSPLAARAADVSARKAYTQTLGDAFKQLGRTLGILNKNAPEFAHIPKDRPVIGIVATLDPWYIANSLARDFLPTASLPTLVASVGDLEKLVAIGQRRSVSEILTHITQAGDERQTWDLGAAIHEFGEPTDRNPLLQQAFARLPFGHTQPDQAA
ncbi:hypothetical protein [Micromonospora inaquosa]|uniref:NERD domain-containing protein n=1 Tax=Micromonospora inaquosa TaxID=2203716 RepID=A0A3N9WXW6_9ACTN|nr:hypothetical protein [Micromonospora inaquosa]RQX05715.1 hypothetical protein DLJ59_06860 [Micromonospora inaquosa]